MTHEIPKAEVEDCSVGVLMQKLQALKVERVNKQNAVSLELMVQGSIDTVEAEIAEKKAKTRDDAARSCYTYL